MAQFKKAMQIVGINEGGYQDDPRDSGNFYGGVLIGTNWGISAPVLAAFLGRTPTKAEMMALPKSTAEQIYKSNYWLRNNFDKLKNQSVATLIYDGAVNHGTNGMRFLVEKALKIMRKPMSYYDVFKLKGIKHLNSLNQRKLFDAIKLSRAEKYGRSKGHYAYRSWMNRLDRIQFYQENTFSALFPIVLVMLGLGLFLIVL